MLRLMTCLVASSLFVGIACSAEQSPSEKAVAKAIKLLESERDKIDDGIERSRLDKIIRDLEEAIEEKDPDAKPAPLKFDVNPATLKKKFAGKAVFNSKTGELTLTYDFPGKTQLADFDVGSKKVLIQKKTLFVEASDELTHIAKWRTFHVQALMTYKELAGAGIASSNGAHIELGGGNHDLVLLGVPNGDTVHNVVPKNLRSGSVPAMFTVTAKKSTGRLADEILSTPFPVLAVKQEEPPHQVVLKAGKSGCGFGNLTISGIPDPEWLQEFLGE